MRKSTIKQIISFALTLALVISMMPAVPLFGDLLIATATEAAVTEEPTGVPLIM